MQTQKLQSRKDKKKIKNTEPPQKLNNFLIFLEPQQNLIPSFPFLSLIVRGSMECASRYRRRRRLRSPSTTRETRTERENRDAGTERERERIEMERSELLDGGGGGGRLEQVAAVWVGAVRGYWTVRERDRTENRGRGRDRRWETVARTPSV